MLAQYHRSAESNGSYRSNGRQVPGPRSATRSSRDDRSTAPDGVAEDSPAEPDGCGLGDGVGGSPVADVGGGAVAGGYVGAASRPVATAATATAPTSVT